MICLAYPPTPTLTQQPTWPTAHTAHSQHCAHTALPPGQKTHLHMNIIIPGHTLAFTKYGFTQRFSCTNQPADNAVGCGVCDTPELWRGAAGLCARVRVRAGAGAAESLHTYINNLCKHPSVWAPHSAPSSPTPLQCHCAVYCMFPPPLHCNIYLTTYHIGNSNIL